MRKHILVVARWPLGGIRTYMRFVYAHLGKECDITILAPVTQELGALREDARAVGAELVVSRRKEQWFFMDICSLLRSGRFDLIQSQGFISAMHAALVNLLFGVPHVLTVHGVLEDRLMQGVMGRAKRALVNRVILGVDAIYAVSEDILSHLKEQVPAIERRSRKCVVIPNGIDTGLFGPGDGKGAFREGIGVGPDVFAIGFVGRLMPQKGLPCLIDALAELEGSIEGPDYRVLVVGSGDYLDWYRDMIRERGLAERFVFVPFQKDMAAVYQGLDMVVMPSEWEACPLQPMEALSTGLPVAASDCIGLREVVRDTPARVFPQGDSGALAVILKEMIETPDTSSFLDFREEAAQRFDVRQTARSAKELFDEICM